MLDINEFRTQIHNLDIERPNLYAVNFGIPAAVASVTGLNGAQMSAPDNNNFTYAYNETEGGKLLTLFCEAARLPGAALNTEGNITRRYGIGPIQKMPTNIAFSDVEFLFIADAKSIIYNFFYKWIEFICPFTDSTTTPGVNREFQLEYKKNYQTNVKVDIFRGAKGKYSLNLLPTATTVISAVAGIPAAGALINQIIGVPSFPLERQRTINLYKAFPVSISDIQLGYGQKDDYTKFTVFFTYFNWNMERVDAPTAESEMRFTGNLGI